MTASGGRWQFWIDRGGTFTDVVALRRATSETTAMITPQISVLMIRYGMDTRWPRFAPL
jgi:hypothetical protein